MATVSGADKKPAGVAIPGLLPGSHWQQTAVSQLSSTLGVYLGAEKTITEPEGHDS